MKYSIIPAAVMAITLSAGVEAQQSAFGQCGGNDWTGQTTCVSGYFCQFSNEWYSQCVPGAASTTTRAASTTIRTSTTTRASSSSTRVSTTTTRASTSSIPSSTPPPSGGSARVDELVGYGRAATGGGSAAATTVTSCSALEAAVGEAGARVVRISGLLSGCGIIDIESDKTVLGVGRSSGLTNGGFRIRDANNVILRNLVFKTPPGGGDLIALDGATNV